MYRKIKIHLLRFICNFPRKSCEPTLDSQSILEPIALARSPTQFPTIVLVVPSWDTAVWMSRKLERKDLVEMTPLTRQRIVLFSECLQQVECLQGSIFLLILFDTLL